jgi:perosamine synthetase
MKIPVARPDLSGNEEKYVVDAIRSTWISSTGKYIERFEKEFSQVCGTEHAIGVSNGTVALHLALLALGIGPGDEVLIPSLTYIATANAVRYVGAEPVFVDVDHQTWTLNPHLIEEKITKHTKAIIPVHIYGHPADMDAINEIASLHGLFVVEDAAEAMLARYKGRPVGSMSHIATFSFFGNKVITSGEGGAITLNDERLAYHARIIRGQGMDPARRYYFPITGHNFRLTNIAAALLCAQMERVDDFVNRRRQIFSEYNKQLSMIPGIRFQPVAPWAEISPWLYCILVDEQEFGCSRDDLMENLGNVEIETRPFFLPLHRLPPFRREATARGDILPVTDELARTGINLPTYFGLSNDEIGYIADEIENIHVRNREKRL